MRKKNIGIIDLLDRGPIHTVYQRVMRANLASIMPQALAVWCEEAGHNTRIGYYNGHENMITQLPDNLDIVFIGSFTQSAYVAYALSKMFQSRGIITVLGGPHARCYPDDAKKYFDYVCGFVDKELLNDIIQQSQRNRPKGLYLSAARQPEFLPTVRQRWKFIKPLLDQAPWIKVVSMIGSMGCPYHCSFCIDADVPYQPMDYEGIQEDLRFVSKLFKKPIVGWHDPNFGIRFDEFMSMIEEAVPVGSIRFIAENSLSVLTEKNVQRLKKNNFLALIPGIESWNDQSNKTRSGGRTGMEKVKKVAEQTNMIMRYIPYLQANFILGMDCDDTAESFHLTKKYLDLAPAAFPGFSQITAFGSAAPGNHAYQQEGRVVGFPFHFLDNTGVMNVRPKHFSWPEFYDYMIDLHQHAFSKTLILKRLLANRGVIPRLANLIKGTTFEGWGKIAYFQRIRQRLDEDREFRQFFEQESSRIPSYFIDRIKHDLGPLWKWLPQEVFH